MFDLTGGKMMFILTEGFCAKMVREMGIIGVSDRLIGARLSYEVHKGFPLFFNDVSNTIKEDRNLATFNDMLAVLKILPNLGTKKAVFFLGNPCYIADSEGYHGSDRAKYGFVLRPDHEGGREVGLVNMQDITQGQLPRDVSVARRVLDTSGHFTYDPSQDKVAVAF